MQHTSMSMHASTCTHTEVSVGVNEPSVTVKESGKFCVCVQLNRPAAVIVTVTMVTQDGSAVNGEGREHTILAMNLSRSAWLEVYVQLL